MPMNNNKVTERNCAICVNRFCPSMTEYPINQERCPQCNRPLSKTISVHPDRFTETKQFERTGE